MVLLLVAGMAEPMAGMLGRLSVVTTAARKADMKEMKMVAM